MPFLPPNQQCQSTEGNWCIRIREKMLAFTSAVLPALSPYLASSPYLVHRLRTLSKVRRWCQKRANELKKAGCYVPAAEREKPATQVSYARPLLMCLCLCLVMVLSPKSSKSIYRNANIGSSQISAAQFVPCKSLGGDAGALCWQNTARLYFMTTTQVCSTY